MDAPPRYTAAAVHIFAVLPASPPSAFCIRVALFSLRELQAIKTHKEGHDGQNSGASQQIARALWTLPAQFRDKLADLGQTMANVAQDPTFMAMCRSDVFGEASCWLPPHQLVHPVH